MFFSRGLGKMVKPSVTSYFKLKLPEHKCIHLIIYIYTSFKYFAFLYSYYYWRKIVSLICGVSHCSQMHIVCFDLNICIMFLLFTKLGRNSNTVQSELSPIVQLMEFGPSPVTVFLNQNHFQYCELPYIFFNIIDYCLLHY